MWTLLLLGAVLLAVAATVGAALVRLPAARAYGLALPVIFAAVAPFVSNEAFDDAEDLSPQIALDGIALLTLIAAAAGAPGALLAAHAVKRRRATALDPEPLRQRRKRGSVVRQRAMPAKAERGQAERARPCRPRRA